MAQAALMRQESRGAHTRVDHPGEKQEWLNYNIVLMKNYDGSMVSEKIEREVPEKDLERIANLTIDEVEKEVSSKS